MVINNLQIFMKTIIWPRRALHQGSNHCKVRLPSDIMTNGAFASRRGAFKPNLPRLRKIELTFNALGEIVFDFTTSLRVFLEGMRHSITSDGYKESSLIQLDILLNGDQVDAYLL